MTRTQRKLVWRTVLTGVTATLAALLGDQLGWLADLEHWLYDWRVLHFQFFQPAPTDKIAFLDIDDHSLEEIGHWPWPRSQLARIMGELKTAGAKVVAFDVVFSEAQPPRSQRQADGSPGAWIDDDDIFAQSLGLVDRTLIPVAFETRPTQDDLVAAFTRDPTQSLDLIASQSASRPGDRSSAPPPDNETLLSARRQAFARRIDQALDEGVTSLADLRLRIDPKEAALTDSPLLRLLSEQRQRVLALRALRRFVPPMLENLPPPLPIFAADPLPPILPLAERAGGTAFVNYLPDDDGVVRSVPLCAEIDGRLYPQMGLSLACALLDVPTSALRIQGDAVVVPRPAASGGDILIPVRQRRSPLLDRPIGVVADIPWFGGWNDWVGMFNDHGQAHMPIIRPWDAAQLEDRIRTNTANADEAVRTLLAVADESQLEEVASKPIPPDQVAPRLPVIRKALEAAEFLRPSMEKMSAADMDAQADQETAGKRAELEKALGDLRQLKPEALAARLGDMEPAERQNYQRLLSSGGLDDYLREFRQRDRAKLGGFMPALLALPTLRDTSIQLDRDLQDVRAELHRRLAGKAVLVGWTAIGALADFVPTSLHAKCPGVVIHGVIGNGILTGRLWRQAAPWVTPALTLLAGIAMTAIIASFSPLVSFVGAALLAAAFVLSNGLLLFNRWETIAGMAGPLAAIILVWAAGSVVRYIVLDSERRRIKSRFQSYVDPELVNFVLENPDNAGLDGQLREMTVAFTDLAGFTTLSEKLGRQTVPLLNEYLGLMVPVIRAHRGYLNKFLGDGIMFFHGAPRDNPAHAANAVLTALEMQALMPEFNRRLVDRGLPPLAMRIGISTGHMVVGDAGAVSAGSASLASDYTVLGDTVNLGSRLEGANKATGSHILATARTIELIDGQFLVRPIGRLRVIGKTESVMTYEPLALRDKATPQILRLAELTARMVEAFIAARFGDCVAAADLLEKECGTSKLAAIYRELCREYLAQPPTAGAFDGQIVLTDK